MYYKQVQLKHVKKLRKKLYAIITKNIWLCTICHATMNALSFCYSVATYFVATVATTVVLIIVSIALVVYYERKHGNKKDKFIL